MRHLISRGQMVYHNSVPHKKISPLRHLQNFRHFHERNPKQTATLQQKKPQNTHVYIKEQLFNVNKIYFQFLKKLKKKKNTGINTIIYFNYLIS